MYGWRRRIGYISPTAIEVAAYDYYGTVPNGFGLANYTCNMTSWEASQRTQALDKVAGAAKHMASRRVDFICHSDLALTSMETDPRFGQSLAERIRDDTGTPATTSADAALLALASLSISSIAVVSPHPAEVHAACIRFFESCDIRVPVSCSLERDFKLTHTVSPAELYDSVRKSFKSGMGQIDGIYIASPQLPSREVVEHLEADIGVPVIGEAASLWWAAFSALGVSERFAGSGKLLGSVGVRQ